MKAMNMKTLAIISCLLAASALSSWSGGNGEPVHYDEIAQITGPISPIDPNSITNNIEARLDKVRLPEVLFAQAALLDVVYFLDHFTKQYETNETADPIRFEFGAGWTNRVAQTATIAGRDISVLQVLRYMQNRGIEITISDQLVTIGKK